MAKTATKFSISHHDLTAPTSRAKPFNDLGWVWELKHYGYRALLIKDGEWLSLQTRKGNERFNSSLKLRPILPDCAIDGELVMLDDKGKHESTSSGDVVPSAIRPDGEIRSKTSEPLKARPGGFLHQEGPPALSPEDQSPRGFCGRCFPRRATAYRLPPKPPNMVLLGSADGFVGGRRYVPPNSSAAGP